MTVLTTSYQAIGSVTDGRFHVYYDMKRDANPDTANNRYKIYRRLRMVVDQYGLISAGSNEFSGTGLTTVSGSGGTWGEGTHILIAETSGWANADNDGNWSQKVNGKANFGGVYVWATSTGTASCPNIPRASVPTLSASTISVNGTNTITVSTNRKSTSFKHTVTITCGKYTKTDTKTITDTVSYVIPVTAFGETTTSNTLSGTVEVTTFNGNTQVGSKATLTFTAICDQSKFAPTISNPTVTEVNYSTTGIASTSSDILKGVSNKKYVVTVTGVQGATIGTSAVKVSVGGGAAQTLTYDSTNKNYYIQINGITSKDLVFSATDSRGISNTKPYSTGTLYNYSPPSITNLEIYRDSETVTTGKLKVNGTYWYTSDKKPKENSITFKFKVGTGSYGSNITPTKNTSNQTWNHTSNLTGLTLANSFTYTVLATDAFGKTAQTSVTLGPAIVAMALGRETAFFNDVVIDKHLAILKSDGTLNGYLDATKFGELLYFSSGAKLLSTGKDVSFTAANIPNLNTSKLTAGVMAAARLPFEYKQKTVSYVSSYLSSGSTVTWHMFRFNSIFTIIYTAFTSSDMACTTAWGSMYYCSPAHSTPSYPITFASMPYSNISYTGASTAGFAIVLPYGDASTSYPGGFSLGRMNSSTMKAPRISIVAIGSFTGTLPSD